MRPWEILQNQGFDFPCQLPRSLQVRNIVLIFLDFPGLRVDDSDLARLRQALVTPFNRALSIRFFTIRSACCGAVISTFLVKAEPYNYGRSGPESRYLQGHLELRLTRTA